MSRAWAETEVVEVVVVGAGPAGMAAAAHAADAGCDVTVIDTYATPGGQYHRGLAPGLDRRGPRPAGAVADLADRVTADRVTADRVTADRVAGGRITVRSATTIWTAEVADGEAPFRLHLTEAGTAATPTADGALDGAPDGATPAGESSLRARSVVLATGATDRVLPFPGWDLPGVLTAGAAQALLKGQGVLAGDRVVVGGSGPFLLPVAASLAAAGSDVLEVVEARALGAVARSAPRGWSARGKITEAAGYATALLRHRVPLRGRSAVTAVAGDGRVEEVTVSRLDGDWSPVAGSERTLPADAACVSFGFVPQVGLAALLGCAIDTDPVWGDPAVTVDALQATSVPGVLAAGEVTGVAGSEAAAVEGAIAGLGAAAAVGRIGAADLVDRTARLRRTAAGHRRFAAALGRMYRRPDGWVRWLRDDTIVCRCEEVEHAAVREAVTDLGADDLRSVKLTTRCGMGYCQGRMCGEAVRAIVTDELGTAPTDAAALSTPPILVPVPLARIAALVERPRGVEGPTTSEESRP
jgi:NADPH-dependent 2,4-dienoyl-CoA reductase/sulfur reductase-like enzyme